MFVGMTLVCLIGMVLCMFDLTSFLGAQQPTAPKSEITAPLGVFKLLRAAEV